MISKLILTVLIALPFIIAGGCSNHDDNKNVKSSLSHQASSYLFDDKGNVYVLEPLGTDLFRVRTITLEEVKVITKMRYITNGISDKPLEVSN